MQMRRQMSWSRRVSLVSLPIMCLALVGGVLVAGSERAAAQDPSVARGQKIAQSLCSKCHATGRADTSPNAKAPAFRDVGKNYPLEHLAEALAEGIITGDNDMPEFKFGPKDIDALIDYIAEMSANR